MISRMRARWQRWRSWLNRSEWMWRLLSLPSAPDDGRPGLVMIQIDGFSHTELQRALKKREMPFLARLLKREHHELRRMYSGLPSNTPAMQGELFYGVPGAVPAFGFFNHKCNRLCKMFEAESAREVERELENQGEPLLKGGTSYSNIYTGGAAEARWCFSSLGWGNTTKAPGPLLLLLLAILNIWALVRAVAYALLELVLGVWDAVRGILRGEGLQHEFKFVAARVGLCIILREWVTAAARMDVARGMPVVHVNFVGYDEQAHRRGPDSAFAHWVLKGIDDSIKRIWKAAKNARRRDYEIWIYSDHGQVKSRSYRLIHGRPLRDTVDGFWRETAPEKPGEEAMPRERGNGRDHSAETERVRLLGGRRLQKFFPIKSESRGKTFRGKSASRDPSAELRGGMRTSTAPEATGTQGAGGLAADASAQLSYPLVSDLGPVGLIYLGPEAPDDRKVALAQRLVREGGVPLVLESRSQPLRVWTDAGEFRLPRDADEILGNHPFRAQVLGDLERVSRHVNAGDLIAYGWKKGIETPVTFALENGSHGGISPEECSAFVMMPRAMERELLRPGVPRPADLHRAAMIAQGRLTPGAPFPAVTELTLPAGSEPVITPVLAPPLSPLFTPAPVEKQFRVMTYNVHSCVGMDQRHDPHRIARVIAHYLPDVVALQELETNLPRSVGMNQAHRIAELLQLEYRFHAVREKDDGAFGNAILTRHPMRLLRSGGLPCLTGRRGCETRGALWVEIEMDGMRLHVLNTHMGLWPRERLMQVKALFGPRWLGGRDKSVPLVVCGDLNCGPRSPTYRELSRHLYDAQLQLHKHRPRNTWFTGFPVARIDHIFVSESLRTRRIHVPSFHLARMASDHLPLVADIAFEPVPTGAEARFTPEPFPAIHHESAIENASRVLKGE